VLGAAERVVVRVGRGLAVPRLLYSSGALGCLAEYRSGASTAGGQRRPAYEASGSRRRRGSGYRPGEYATGAASSAREGTLALWR